MTMPYRLYHWPVPLAVFCFPALIGLNNSRQTLGPVMLDTQFDGGIEVALQPWGKQRRPPGDLPPLRP